MNKSPKKLWKRSLGIVLTAVMVITAALPAAAYGVELNARAGGFSEAIAGTIEILAGNGNSAEDGIWLTQGAEGGSADAATAAMEYLKSRYVNGTGRITSTYSTREEGSYNTTIPLTSDKNALVNSISMAYENGQGTVPGESGWYKSGWYIKNQDEVKDLFKKTWTPRNPRSIVLNRPAAGEEPREFHVILRLFDKSADDKSVINAETADTTDSQALAEAEFTITILPKEATYDVAFKVIDKDTNEEIPGAKITFQKNWSDVPASNGIYQGLALNQEYSLAVEADGYKSSSNYSYYLPSGLETGKTNTIEIPLEKIVFYHIAFRVKDSSGNEIKDPKITVKQGWTTIKAESDGTYKLQKGVGYTYTISADGYEEKTGSITPSGSEPVTVELKKTFNKYNVTFQPVCDEELIHDATITVTHEEEDEWDEDEGTTVTDKANENGSYTLNKDVTYTYTIEAEGYKTATGTYTPSGEKQDITERITMEPTDVELSAREKVAAIKKKFDDELGALRPKYATDKNINEMILEKIKKYDGIDTSDVTVSVKTSDNTEYIKEDGTIQYNKGTLSTATNVHNVECEFQFKCKKATAVSEKRTVTVGWDQEYFKSQMQKEADSLNWDTIKGKNITADDVTTDLTLPQCMGSSAMQVWSKILWSSSNSDVISFEDTGWGSLIDPKKGVIHQPEQDTTVTLTATFQANDSPSVLNEYVEKVSDFGIITKTFEVTVKGKQAAKPTEEELQAILDKYYTADGLQDFNTKETLDTSNVTGDIQLSRYTRIEDENGDCVFANKEITVTADNADKGNILTVDAYRVKVDRFASQNEKETVNLIVTFTRDGVTVSKKIPLTVSMITDKELDKELAMMEKAKQHYFDGINDGKYADKDSITGNLHAFCEMSLNEQGNPVWAYNVNDKTGTGIIPDDYQDGSLGQTGWPYNRFKSSNNAIVTHENLLVTRPENSTQITISSLLSSEKYGKFAKDHPNNEKLQKLYKQEVSVTVTVKGTKASAEALLAEIESARKLHDSMVEGTQPGEYQKGAKAALAEAIARAQAVADDKDAAEAQQDAAIAALQQAVKNAKALQNAKEAAVSVRINMDSGKPGKSYTLKVTSDMAAKAGFSKPEGFENTVTILDAMVAAHQKMYGDDFGKDPGKYLIVNGGWIQKFWGTETGAIGYLLNDQSPADLNGTPTLCNNSPIKAGDVVTVYQYGDTQNYSDTYLYFVDSRIQQKEPGEVSLTLLRSGYDANWKPVSSPQENCKVVLTDSNGKQIAEAATDKDGIVTFKISEAGSYSADVTAAPFDYYVSAHADITIGDSQAAAPDDPSKDDTKKDDPKKDNAIQDLNKNKTSLQTAAGGNDGSDGSGGGSASGGSTRTGDDAQVYVWMMLMLASMVAAVYIYAAVQRRDDRF